MIFPGRELYRGQHKTGWKKAYQDRRSDHIGAGGGADETAGNSTLQIGLSSVEVLSTASAL